MQLEQCSTEVEATDIALDCVLVQGILETYSTPARLEVIRTDSALHHFPSSLLRIPTKAITTLPRDENVRTSDEQFAHNGGEQKSAVVLAVNGPLGSTDRPLAYGGSWIMGSDKGVYLRATTSSLLCNNETDDDSESIDEFQFPFSGLREMNEEEDAAAAAESHRREKEEEALQRQIEEERAERDRRNEQEAWSFFAGSISRGRAEALLEYVLCTSSVTMIRVHVLNFCCGCTETASEARFCFAVKMLGRWFCHT